MINSLFVSLIIAFAASDTAATPATQPVAAAGPTLRVLSFNIRYGTANDGENRWENRRELVFDVLRRHKPDVAGLQEALRFQLDELAAALPDYAEIGVGRDDGKGKGEFNPILYRKDRLRPVSSGTFWYSDTPERPGSRSWGNHLPRLCTWARFVPITASGEPADADAGAFYFFNTHLDHESQPSRERSAELLIARIRAREHPDPFVVTGDFNVGEDNPVVAYLTGKSRRASSGPAPAPPPLDLLDTYRVLHPQRRNSGTFNAFKGTRSGAKIDYIFVPPRVAVLEAAILYDNRDGRYPSDHFPVFAVIRLP